MSIFTRIIVILVIAWIFLRTASYGKWTWKRNNKLGGAMVVLLALFVVLLTIFQMFVSR